MEKLEERIQKAMAADRDAVGALLRDPSDKVVMALLSNPNITEDHLCILARRRDLPGDVLGAVGGRKFSAQGYKVKLALINNPRTPRTAALGFLRSLELRDVAFTTRNKALPTELRQAAEGMLKEKLPTMPLGIKITLARLVSEEVVKTLLMEEDPQLVKACFENPRMNEAVVLWAVNHRVTPARVLEFISASQKWSASYRVRFALVRNALTPVEKAIDFVQKMKSTDLRYLYNDPAVPASVKVQVEIELEKKGERLTPPSEGGRIIGIADEDF
jgi:hypothetical protein